MTIKIYSYLLVILLILAFLFPLSSKEHTIEITFRRGETISDLSKKLKENKIIRFESFFKLLVKMSGKEKNIRSGIYKLVHNEGEVLTFFRIINQKPKPIEVKVTIYEGMNSFQIARLLAEKLKINSNRFLELVNDKNFIKKLSERYDKLKNLMSLEGFLFPETYTFFEGEDERFIIEILVATFFKRIEPIDSLFKKSHLGFYDVIKLASIVEKEAKFEDEKPIIASVFLNRLRINMALQANPTIAYVLRKNSYWLDDSALKYNSPYNTYLYPGLPPTPICSPSLSSIIAVLKPEDTKYLYFVADGRGRHLFAKTHDEHLKNIMKIRRKGF